MNTMTAISKPYPLFTMIQWWIDLFNGAEQENAA